MSEALEPCPFCGQPAEAWQDNCDYAGCVNEKCEMKPYAGPYASPEDAATVWNTRPSSSPSGEETCKGGEGHQPTGKGGA